jgi:hypothetical protein
MECLPKSWESNSRSWRSVWAVSRNFGSKPPPTLRVALPHQILDFTTKGHRTQGSRLVRSGMASSINHHDSRDLELQREIQAAREVFLNAAGDERSIAKGHYLKLLKAFAARVFGREPAIPGQ